MIPLLAAPIVTKISIATIVSVALFSSGVYFGIKIGTSSCQEAIIESQKRSLEIKQKQSMVSDKSVTNYVDSTKKIQNNSRKIIEGVKNVKIGKLSTTLSGDFRVLHDHASQNTVPDPARDFDAAPTEIRDVAETVARNYGIFQETSNQLLSLQEWIRNQIQVE